MYKKILLLIVAVVLSIILTGCTKYSTTLEITNKNTAILTHTVAVDSKVSDVFKSFGYSNDEIFKEDNQSEETKKYLDDLRHVGYAIYEFKNDNFSGRQFRKTYKKAQFIPPAELPVGYVVDGENPYPVSISVNPFKTKYSINFKFDRGKIQEYKDKNIDRVTSHFSSPDVQNNLQQAASQSQAESLDLTIKIPKKATKHNATKVDEKTHEYTWVFSDMPEVAYNRPVEVILEYEKTNFLSLIFLLFVIIATIYILSKNKNYTKKQTNETSDAF